jgi:large subunit ribosomal protein L15
VVTSEPNYFGKHGFTSPQSLHTKVNAINLVKLDLLAKGSEINLTELGYTKLLGTGKITKPMTIHVAAYSKSAQEKVTQAGGKIVAPQTHGE